MPRPPRFLAALLAALLAAACAPLLQADFDDMAAGTLPAGAVDLPGAPSGDRLIVANFAQVATPLGGAPDRRLYIHRNANTSVSGNHGEVYFDPLDAGGDRPIFFTWRGEVAGFESPGTSAPLAAVKLRDLSGPDQPNLFSKLTFRYGPGRLSVETPGHFVETAIGFGVEGPHNVLLRIDPDGGYVFDIRGAGVSPGAGVTHQGSLPAGVTVDPANIGITLTLDDALDAGGTVYVVDDMFVSDRGAR